MKKRLKLGVLIFVAILLIAGMVYADISCTRWYKTEKLIQAITSENIELVNLLLAEGADPNRTDIPASWLWTLLEMSLKRPLAVACKTGNLEIGKLLIDYGATAEPIDGTGFSPLRETLCFYHPAVCFVFC